VIVWVTWAVIILVHWQFPVTTADVGWDYLATLAAPILTGLLWLRPQPHGCTGQQFERIVVRALIRRRCKVEHVGGAGDGGVDIVATWPGPRLRPWVRMRPVAIQVKHTAEVGLGPLRDLVAATGHDGRYLGCGRMLITTGHLAPQARKYAGPHRIDVVEREQLGRILGRRVQIPVPESAMRRRQARR
jgi:Restriction endonuclease